MNFCIQNWIKNNLYEKLSFSFLLLLLWPWSDFIYDKPITTGFLLLMLFTLPWFYLLLILLVRCIIPQKSTLIQIYSSLFKKIAKLICYFIFHLQTTIIIHMYHIKNYCCSIYTQSTYYIGIYLWANQYICFFILANFECSISCLGLPLEIVCFLNKSEIGMEFKQSPYCCGRLRVSGYDLIDIESIRITSANYFPSQGTGKLRLERL